MPRGRDWRRERLLLLLLLLAIAPVVWATMVAVVVATFSQTPTPTPVPLPKPLPTSTPSLVPTSTATPTITATATNTATATATNTATPTATATATQTATVTAIPPLPRLKVELTLSVTGNRVDATVTFTERDPSDAREAEVDWGDNTTEKIPSPVTSPFEACHLYDGPGDYDVVARVADSLGSAASAKLAVVYVDPYHVPEEVDSSCTQSPKR